MQNLQQEIVNFEIDKRFIPGVYYYCNRMCSQCETSVRCSNYMLFNDLWPKFGSYEKPGIDFNNDEGVLSAIFKFVYAIQSEFDTPHPELMDEIDTNTEVITKTINVGLLMNDWFSMMDTPINVLTSRLKNDDFLALRNNLETLIHNVVLVPKRVSLLYTTRPEYGMVNRMALAKTTLLSLRNIKAGLSEITARIEDYNELEIEILKALTELTTLIETDFAGALKYKRPGIDG